MSMLSPSATYHAELRQQLESVGRALSVQRGLVWLARGLAAGTLVVLGLVIWAWTRDGVGSLPIPLMVAAPVALALLAAAASLMIRQTVTELARRVDRAARLQERSTTALELGARGEEFPLAVAQMRDAVEHLKRVDLLEAFPLRLPRNELMTAGFVVLIAAIIGISPNPWLLRARASNPAITIAREQAQRVQRLADTLPPNDSAEIDALRQLISKGARTIDARSNEPDAALNALQDLEDQVQQMGAGDDQLSAALAAIASALAGDQTTQPLASAINTGDMRQISQAARDLAQATKNLSPQDQQRVAQVLRDAASRAGRVSQNVANDLSNAADGLQTSAAAADAANTATQSQAGQADGQQQQQAGASGAQSASDALNQLSNSAAAADARQRASSQLESSRNALERALGRTQSRSGNTGSSSSSRGSSSSGQNGANSSQADGQSQQGDGQGQNGDQSGQGMDPNGAGSQADNQNGGGETGQGGGYSAGGQGQNQNSSASNPLDAITSPQQVPSNGNVSPDQSSQNPYTSDAGTGDVQSAPEAVQPNYSNKPTQGNDSGSIPLGLRDLVKDYFSSLDQK
ncbi:MAG TPA: hypothetical protein VF937_16790 [Chloroflexota bacterium]